MKDPHTFYTGDLHRGDMIVIASGSYLSIGFYLGLGRAGNIQYYTLNRLSRWLDRDLDIRSNFPYVDFINTYEEHRIVKYTPEFLDEPNMRMYEKSIKALKQLKIIRE